MKHAIRWVVWFMTAFSVAANWYYDPRCIMYLTGQHYVVPGPELTKGITHVILAFMPSHVFNVDETPTEFPLFTTVDKVRQQFPSNTTVTVAIGGWGDSKGFEEGARNKMSRKRWAKQVKAMVDGTGADGVDIDWEYPGGNRDDYKVIPNSKRVWEIEAYVSLLQELRAALGPNKIISAAVPGLERDMMAFTASTVPRIMKELDFINVMTYDLMNRRDAVITHHSGISSSIRSVVHYRRLGVSDRQLNLGLGYYVKWFMTEDCDPDKAHRLECRTQLLEDPKSGADLGRTGAFSWHDQVPTELANSFHRAQTEGGLFDDRSYGYWDAKENRWWSYDTSETIEDKIENILENFELGGIFAWGLGEDAPAFSHLKATIDGVAAIRGYRPYPRDEL